MSNLLPADVITPGDDVSQALMLAWMGGVENRFARVDDAVDSSTISAIYDTYADAVAAGGAEGDLIEVLADETLRGRRTRHRWESGALVRKYAFPVGVASLHDFGAVGDGVSDDTAAIVAALNETAAAGKSLYVPPGRYIYDANSADYPATPPGWFIVRGEGPASVIEVRGQAQFQPRSGLIADNLLIEVDDLLTQDVTLTRAESEAGVPLFDNGGLEISNLHFTSRCHVRGKDAPADGSERHENYITLSGGHDFGDVRIDATLEDVIVGVWIFGYGTLKGRIVTRNYKTGVNIFSVMDTDCTIDARNTPEQATRWRPTREAQSRNGADAILIEARPEKASKTRLDVYAEYPIERPVYAQHVANGRIKSYCFGGEGVKVVDGSHDLDVWTVAIIQPDTPYGRFAYQSYSGGNGPVRNIRVHSPTLINLKDSLGNAEAFSLYGECENITAYDIRGHNCGWAGWIITGSTNEEYILRLDNIRILGLRLTGTVSHNGALNLPVGMPGSAGYENYDLGHIEIRDVSCPPGVGGRAVTLRGWRSAVVSNININGVKNRNQFNEQVAVLGDGDYDVASWQQGVDESYPRYEDFIPVSALPPNATAETALFQHDDLGVDNLLFELELSAAHNAQVGYYVDAKWRGEIGRNGQFIPRGTVDSDHITLALTYDAASRTVSLNSTSATPFGMHRAMSRLTVTKPVEILA